jgi:hypothetical protein
VNWKKLRHAILHRFFFEAEDPHLSAYGHMHFAHRLEAVETLSIILNIIIPEIRDSRTVLKSDLLLEFNALFAAVFS